MRLRAKATAPAAVGQGDSAVGLAAATGAALIWAIYPFYFKALGSLPIWEVVAHRGVWTVVVLAPFLALARLRHEVMAALRRRATLLGLGATMVLIAVNWIVYTWLVVNGRVMEASLGYFLSPLVAVGLGVVLLKERLRPLQLGSILIAAAAVVLLAVRAGSLPGLGLALAVSFALYGAVRKRLPVGPAAGLFVECLLGLPLALTYLAWTAAQDVLAFPTGRPALDLLVAASGVMTAVPLVLFNIGAKRLTYVTVGMMLYVAPSLMFVEATLVFGEPLEPARLLTFVGIWAALALYTLDGVLRLRARRVHPA